MLRRIRRSKHRILHARRQLRIAVNLPFPPDFIRYIPQRNSKQTAVSIADDRGRTFHLDQKAVSMPNHSALQRQRTKLLRALQQHFHIFGRIERNVLRPQWPIVAQVIAKPFGKTGVGLQDHAALRFNHQDRFRRLFDQSPVPRLAFGQCLFALFADDCQGDLRGNRGKDFNMLIAKRVMPSRQIHRQHADRFALRRHQRRAQIIELLGESQSYFAFSRQCLDSFSRDMDRPALPHHIFRQASPDRSAARHIIQFIGTIRHIHTVCRFVDESKIKNPRRQYPRNQLMDSRIKFFDAGADRRCLGNFTQNRLDFETFSQRCHSLLSFEFSGRADRNHPQQCFSQPAIFHRFAVQQGNQSDRPAAEV